MLKGGDVKFIEKFVIENEFISEQDWNDNGSNLVRTKSRLKNITF